MQSTQIIESGKYSGSVSFDDSQIIWRGPRGRNVVIKLDEVAIIGEYTTANGPFVDDWFLTFVYKSGEWKNIPIYAKGIDELMQHLSKVFKSDLTRYQLASSTDSTSLITYPVDLAGKAIFIIKSPPGYKSPKTFIQQVKSAIGTGAYGKNWEIELTEEVRRQIKDKNLPTGRQAKR